MVFLDFFFFLNKSNLSQQRMLLYWTPVYPRVQVIIQTHLILNLTNACCITHLAVHLHPQSAGEGGRSLRLMDLAHPCIQEAYTCMHVADLCIMPLHIRGKIHITPRLIQVVYACLHVADLCLMPLYIREQTHIIPRLLQAVYTCLHVRKRLV